MQKKAVALLWVFSALLLGISFLSADPPKVDADSPKTSCYLCRLDATGIVVVTRIYHGNPSKTELQHRTAGDGVIHRILSGHYKLTHADGVIVVARVKSDPVPADPFVGALIRNAAPHTLYFVKDNTVNIGDGQLLKLPPGKQKQNAANKTQQDKPR